MYGKRCHVMLFIAVLASFVLLQQPRVTGNGHAYAQEDGAAKTKESCITGKCHADMGKGKFVHGPVAAEECAVCHKRISKHKFEPIGDVGKLCEECHEKLNTMKVVHKPVEEGKCTKCHDPHQSSYRFQLRAQGNDLCFLCHSKALTGGTFVHGPVTAGGCTTCHSVHQSEFPKLLMAKGNDVCFTCHADEAEAFKKKKFMHEPAKEACVNCHSPHSANFKYNLVLEGNRDLCYSCHTDKETEINEATVPHKGIDTDKRCLACHSPHGADYPKQLVRQPAGLCLGCHDRTYGSGKGKIMNMKAFLGNNSMHHGPIRQKDCTGCHNPHGSKNFRILRENFPQFFYAGYNQDNYKLCFMCHEKTLASDQITTTLTNFRNGDRNLHFVHVNKEVKGRTCRACHDVHATNNPKHIRDAVPFAKWQLPVGFTKTETGGQCLPGCHTLYRYDRAKPFVNKPAAKKSVTDN